MAHELLLEVNEDGILSLMDGSKWQINPGDISTAICWSPTARIEVKEANQAAFFGWTIINLENNSEIKGVKLV